jgi:general secretion pathway protein G
MKSLKLLMRNQTGFTLVEILIVIIILGILAGVVIPQFTSSSEDAKLSTLTTNLRVLRSAVLLYHIQHNKTYPGAKDSNFNGHAAKEEWFVDQLTLYTDAKGEAVSVKDATHKYGPYLKSGIPVNPFDDSNAVIVDNSENDLSLASEDGTGGWKFFVLTGQFFANDGAHGQY